MAYLSDFSGSAVCTPLVSLLNSANSGYGCMLVTTSQQFAVPNCARAVRFQGVGGGGNANNGTVINSGTTCACHSGSYSGSGAGYFLKKVTNPTSGYVYNLTVGSQGGATYLKDCTCTVLACAGGAGNSNTSAPGAVGTACGGDINSSGTCGALYTYGGASGGPLGSNLTAGIGSWYMWQNYVQGLAGDIINNAFITTGCYTPYCCNVCGMFGQNGTGISATCTSANLSSCCCTSCLCLTCVLACITTSCCLNCTFVCGVCTPTGAPGNGGWAGNGGNACFYTGYCTTLCMCLCACQQGVVIGCCAICYNNWPTCAVVTPGVAGANGGFGGNGGNATCCGMCLKICAMMQCQCCQNFGCNSAVIIQNQAAGGAGGWGGSGGCGQPGPTVCFNIDCCSYLSCNIASACIFPQMYYGAPCVAACIKGFAWCCADNTDSTYTICCTYVAGCCSCGCLIQIQPAINLLQQSWYTPGCIPNANKSCYCTCYAPSFCIYLGGSGTSVTCNACILCSCCNCTPVSASIIYCSCCVAGAGGTGGFGGGGGPGGAAGNIYVCCWINSLGTCTTCDSLCCCWSLQWPCSGNPACMFCGFGVTCPYCCCNCPACCQVCCYIVNLCYCGACVTYCNMFVNPAFSVGGNGGCGGGGGSSGCWWGTAYYVCCCNTAPNCNCCSISCAYYSANVTNCMLSFQPPAASGGAGAILVEWWI